MFSLNRTDTDIMPFHLTSRTWELALHHPGGRPWWTKVRYWVGVGRSQRVLCLVAGIWVMNGFDLVFTLLSHQQGVLDEANPVARRLLECGAASLILYKFGLVLIGSYPLLKFRSCRITELGALVILLVYATLAVRWSNCYELYTALHGNDLTLAEINALLPPTTVP